MTTWTTTKKKNYDDGDDGDGSDDNDSKDSDAVDDDEDNDKDDDDYDDDNENVITDDKNISSNANKHYVIIILQLFAWVNVQDDSVLRRCRSIYRTKPNIFSNIILTNKFNHYS